MRENFSTRILVRYTLNAWRMLVPEVSPIPMPTEHHGRVQVATRGRAQETQVLNLSNAEAREWAMSGVHASGKTGTGLPKATAPATPPADFLADAWSITPAAPAGAPSCLVARLAVSHSVSREGLRRLTSGGISTAAPLPAREYAGRRVVRLWLWDCSGTAPGLLPDFSGTR
ncbi:hypothetical protein ACFWGL_40105 [Streptomyces sp. NPDC060286]|uniref:hypothetical protein n=1 Tax=unclassified Streptomyces TaxID=2593676 RepID=UPI0035D5D873